MNYHYNIMLEISRKQANQEQLYLLLAIKSLTHHQGEFKKYLLKINSLDHDSQCEIDNLFQHNCEYVYKLWPCSKSSRQFIRIQIFEKLGKEQIVKRGQASPVIFYRQQGQKFQFTGSKQQKYVLILNFKINSTSSIQHQISSKEFTQLNEQIEQGLNKNKQETQLYNRYLQNSNRFVKTLDNAKYLTGTHQQSPIQEEQKKMNRQYITDDVASPIKFYQVKQSLSNNKYLQRIMNAQKQTNEQLINLPINPLIMLKKKSNISNQIKNKRDAYTRPNTMMNQPPNKPISFMQQARFNYQDKYRHYDPYRHQDKQQQTERVQTKEIGIQLEEQIQRRRQSSREDSKSLNQSKISVVVRTNDFPLNQGKKERKKKTYSQNKQTKQSYSNTINQIENVDLQGVFRVKAKRSINDQGQLLRIDLLQTKAYLFRCNYELPKKLIINYERQKFQALSQQMKGKQVQWKDKIIIKKARASLPLKFKIVSVHDFSTTVEGEAEILIKELVKAKQCIKIYLYCNQIAIGFLEIRLKTQPYVEQDTNDASTLRIERERKTISLPQINKIKKESKRYEKEKLQSINTNSKSSMGSSNSKVSLRKHPSIYIGKIKRKKLKLKPKLN